MVRGDGRVHLRGVTHIRDGGNLMPKRFITEECCTSRTFARTSAEAEVLCHRLWAISDDYGIFPADPEVVASRAFTRRPYWFKGTEHAARLLTELTSEVNGDPPPIRIYVVNGVPYGIFGPGWDRSQ